MIRGAPIGKRFEHCTFENFEVTDENRDAYQACLRLAADGDVGVLIRGKNGLGKTHLLVATMKEYDERRSRAATTPDENVALAGVPSASEMIRLARGEDSMDASTPSLAPDEIDAQCHIEYWPLLDLTSELRAEISRGSLEVSKRCRECDLLVLDDFGAERATDFAVEELERIVDWRYRAMKPTAVATNLDFKRITMKYGQRAMSRWMASCEVVGVFGEDRRASMEPS